MIFKIDELEKNNLIELLINNYGEKKIINISKKTEISKIIKILNTVKKNSEKKTKESHILPYECF